MKPKDKYIVDDKNRLIMRRGGKNLPVPGRFKVDENNRLIYWLNETSPWRRMYNLPSKMVFEGRWQLNPDYDLELRLSETRNKRRQNSLVLKGEIISICKDAIVFELKSTDLDGLSRFQLLKLTGIWQADKYNRICFLVNKKAAPDTLVLGSSWQINKNQQITYSYTKVDLKTKTKTAHNLSFEGFWQIDSASRITYILSRSLGSQFDFRVQLESPSLYPQNGLIKYRLGVGLRQEKTFNAKIISLYGAWKIGKKLGISFIIDYGQGKINKIEFGSNVYITKKDEITLSLINRRKEPLGINLTFTHKFLKQCDAQAYLRLKKQQKEAGVEAGVRIPF
ncbi:MAG: hypothetical protein V1674_07550 [Candidatus Omnitrophota bacterium]